MTEIDKLIKQAKLRKKHWKPLKSHPVFSHHSWQELLDSGDYPKLRFGKL